MSSPAFLRVIENAAFLASSWTWCIGMFLPVLLVRDFGVWGFVAFAVPNCLGAAAMGWVLKSPGQSMALVNRHAVAMRLFSIVTILFHVFFLAWLGSWKILPMRVEALIAIAAVASVVVVLINNRVQGWLGVLLWAGVVFVLARATLGDLATALSSTHLLPATTALPVQDVIYLAPVCLFGFALCPYLDLTFQKARQSLDAPSAGGAAFSLGFLLFFPTMILFTLVYAGVFLFSKPLSLALICTHIAIQAGYTVGVHAQALAALHRTQRARTLPAHASSTLLQPQLLTSVLITWLLAMLIQGVFKHQLAESPPAQLTAAHALTIGEVVYRCFMAFYGLALPAYVWICMIPTRTSPQGEPHAGLSGPLGQRKFWTLLVAIAAASPFYYLGFIERQTHWLAVGLGVVLLSRLVASSPGKMAK